MVERIEFLCKLSNLSVFKLEKLLKYGRGSIRTWNERKPSIAKIIEVAIFFGVSLDWLCGMTDQRNELNNIEIIKVHKAFKAMSNEEINDAIAILKIVFKKYF